MIRFECDYLEGAHRKIIERLVMSNEEQCPGYSTDIHCEAAKKYVRALCHDESVDVHFLVGGTQTNMTVIASVLRPHQGVVAASTGHVNVHETGAIESTGHKVIVCDSENGKLTAEAIEKLWQNHVDDPSFEHIVQPGMVYITHPSEIGTLYTKAELTAISKVCKSHNLPLYLDGARLGYGLAAEENDISIEDINNLCDAFYIGGTKVGALFGEAVVIKNPSMKKDFRYIIKQRGGLLAKGRLLGVQFEVLFENGLYFDISKNAVSLAQKIKKALTDSGYKLFIDSPTNQQFVIMPNEKIEALSKKYSFGFWEKIDENNTAIRICTSWATKEKDVDALINDIKSL